MLKLMSIVGARPNFMKIAPFVRAIRQHNAAHPGQPVEHVLVHTGQHYDPSMSDAFFLELDLPAPTVNLGVGSGSPAYQIGQTMIEFEKPLLAHRPDWVVVVGDVNATAACAMVARKYQVRVAHIEAGLRSNDWSMPEEINRVVTDRLSNLLFTTDRFADENLRREGVLPATVCRVGNIMIDTLEHERRAAGALVLHDIVDALLEPDRYGVVTLHRPSNVDAIGPLTALVKVLREIAQTLPLVFPVHPRTRARLMEFNLWEQLSRDPQIVLTEPLTYREMLRLNMDAKVCLTDSGGLQEECTVLGTHCLTLRNNTERPITLRENGGTNLLVGSDPAAILKAFHETLPLPRHSARPEFWDGHTAERILTYLVSATL
jgi:UDP-N-acetylglucosamine 2-epimerase (non-hydrolysing)